MGGLKPSRFVILICVRDLPFVFGAPISQWLVLAYGRDQFEISREGNIRFGLIIYTFVVLQVDHYGNKVSLSPLRVLHDLETDVLVTERFMLPFSRPRTRQARWRPSPAVITLYYYLYKGFTNSNSINRRKVARLEYRGRFK